MSSNKPPQEVHDLLLHDSGGPMQSNSMLQEPRNLKQIRNRQSATRKSLLQSTNETISEQANDHLHTLLRAHRDSDSFLKTVMVTTQSYIAFAYTKKQLSDIEKFCCKSTEAGVFTVDITFNLCDLWITDTSYRKLVSCKHHRWRDSCSPCSNYAAFYQRWKNIWQVQTKSLISKSKSKKYLFHRS